MKSKILFAGLLLAGFSVNAQTTSTTSTTTHGLSTGQGADQNVHVGYEAGRDSKIGIGIRNVFCRASVCV